jgi:stalled ribosome alternative rescue factor ArfA
LCGAVAVPAQAVVGLGDAVQAVLHVPLGRHQLWRKTYGKGTSGCERSDTGKEEGDTVERRRQMKVKAGEEGGARGKDMWPVSVKSRGNIEA